MSAACSENHPRAMGLLCGPTGLGSDRHADEFLRVRQLTENHFHKESCMDMSRLKVSTPTDTTVVMTRSFNAPRRLVWEAMTDPSKLRRWMFAPPGWIMTVCEFDARVGGGYRWAWKTDQADPVMTIHGVITEVVPHERVAHTQTMEMAQCGPAANFSVTLELSEQCGITRMQLTLTYPSKAARDNALTWGMERGMEAGYVQLDAMLAQSA